MRKCFEINLKVFAISRFILDKNPMKEFSENKKRSMEKLDIEHIFINHFINLRSLSQNINKNKEIWVDFKMLYFNSEERMTD